MERIWVLAVVLAFVAGSVLTGAAVFADDDDDLSQLACEAGKVMTGILFEDDDEILDVICDDGAAGPQGPKGDKGDPGEPGTGGSISCDNQFIIKESIFDFIIDSECLTDSDGDGVIDRFDNCPDVVNPDQNDNDGNGIGTACDNEATGNTTSDPVVIPYETRVYDSSLVGLTDTNGDSRVDQYFQITLPVGGGVNLEAIDNIGGSYVFTFLDVDGNVLNNNPGQFIYTNFSAEPFVLIICVDTTAVEVNYTFDVIIR